MRFLFNLINLIRCQSIYILIIKFCLNKNVNVCEFSFLTNHVKSKSVNLYEKSNLKAVNEDMSTRQNILIVFLFPLL